MRSDIRTRARLVALPAALLLAGCNKGILDVPNRNNPDVTRAYSTPAGVEAIIAGTYLQVWSASMACTDCVPHQARMLALETYSELGNNGNGTRSQIPRGPILNDRSIEQAAANLGLYSALARTGRQAANAVQALDRLVAASTATPKNALGSRAQDARARGFGFFNIALTLVGLATYYDSAAIVTPAVPADEIPPLSDYKAVMTAALAMFDSALAIANSAAATDGANGFPLPTTWISANAFTRDQFVRLILTYKARSRAAVARTPAERAAVDWNAVIADAGNGLTTDFVVTVTSSGGWGSPYVNATPSGGLLSMLFYGMADTSGAYANFISSPMQSRDGGFLIRTPDLRFPQGATRAAQQTDTPLPLPGRRYMRNRPTGEDLPVNGYGFSFYEHRRSASIAINSGNGPYTSINKIEMDMLVAEAHIRAGNFAAAAALIDASRARNGLPSIGTITSATQAIAGGNGCVPKVPQAPAFNTVGCGTILEAMKWEKRMEAAYSCHYSCWFTDSRGWGDLVQNTALQWPVPFQEMDARLQPFYTIGGGGPSSASKGTYGY